MRHKLNCYHRRGMFLRLKRGLVYKTKKYHWREKSAFQLYLETPMPPVPATKDTIRKRTNKEIKGINQHYKATSLDSRKMFI